MTNKVSIQDVVNGTPAGKEAVQRAVEASIKDQDAMSAKAQAMRSDTNELDEIMEWVKWAADRNEGLLDSHKRHAHTKLQTLIASKEAEARIDELESIAETDDGALCLVGDDLGGVTIKDRLTTLKAQLKETPSYDE